MVVNVVKIQMRVRKLTTNSVVMEQDDDAQVASYGKVYLSRDALTKAGYDVSSTAKARKSVGTVNVKISIVKPDQS